MKMTNKYTNKKSKGASLVEYAVLTGLISILSIGAVLSLGEEISSNFETVEAAIALDANSPGNGNSGGNGSGGAGGGGFTPPTPTTACIDADEPLINAIASGAITLVDAGIGDCINVGPNAGYLDLSQPGFPALPPVFHINYTTTGLAPFDVYGDVQLPAAVAGVATVSLTPGAEIGLYGGTSDTIINFLGITDPDVTVTDIGMGLLRLDIASFTAQFFMENSYDQVYADGDLISYFDLPNFNQVVQGFDIEALACMDTADCAGTATSTLLTRGHMDFTDSDILDLFYASNGGTLTVTVSGLGSLSGYQGFNHFGGGNVEVGYWEYPAAQQCDNGGDISGFAPAPGSITVSYTNGVDTFVVNHNVVPETPFLIGC